MIIDTIQYAQSYFHLSEPLRVGLEYLVRTDLSSLSQGRHEIDGDKVYANVMELRTKFAAESKWEAHKRYIDIHMLISGAERIGFAPASSLRAGEYFEETDHYLLEGKGQEITIYPGQFVILMPQDAHMPALAVDSPASIKKVVVKVINSVNHKTQTELMIINS